MKIKTLNIIFILILLLAFTANSIAAETIAVVLKVKGTVALQRGGNNASGAKLKRGYRLENGDKLVTGKKGMLLFVSLMTPVWLEFGPIQPVSFAGKRSKIKS